MSWRKRIKGFANWFMNLSLMIKGLAEAFAFFMLAIQVVVTDVQVHGDMTVGGYVTVVVCIFVAFVCALEPRRSK